MFKILESTESPIRPRKSGIGDGGDNSGGGGNDGGHMTVHLRF